MRLPLAAACALALLIAPLACSADERSYWTGTHVVTGGAAKGDVLLTRIKFNLSPHPSYRTPGKFLPGVLYGDAVRCRVVPLSMNGSEIEMCGDAQPVVVRHDVVYMGTREERIGSFGSDRRAGFLSLSSGGVLVDSL